MKKVLIGNGGHAREVMAQMGVNLIRFVDDQYVDNDTLPLSQFDPTKHIAMVAVADTLPATAFKLADLIATSAIPSLSVSVEGLVSEAVKASAVNLTNV